MLSRNDSEKLKFELRNLDEISTTNTHTHMQKHVWRDTHSLPLKFVFVNDYFGIAPLTFTVC